MGFDWLNMKSTYEYADYCDCDGYYIKDTDRAIIITNPPKYPVKCKICNKKSYSMLKSDVEAFKKETGIPSKVK